MGFKYVEKSLPTTWRNREGVRTEIKTMSYDYVINLLRYLKRQGRGNAKQIDWWERPITIALVCELEVRGIMFGDRRWIERREIRTGQQYDKTLTTAFDSWNSHWACTCDDWRHRRTCNHVQPASPPFERIAESYLNERNGDISRFRDDLSTTAVSVDILDRMQLDRKRMESKLRRAEQLLERMMIDQIGGDEEPMPRTNSPPIGGRRRIKLRGHKP